MNRSTHPWLSANVIASESTRSHRISRDQLLGEHLTLNIPKLSEKRREFRTNFTQQSLGSCAPVKRLDSQVLWGVIVETRPLPALEHSVLSVVKKCQIPVQIFHSSANLDFIMNSRVAALVAAGTVILTPLNVPKKIAIDGYNALLLSQDFWEAMIERQKVLIFQHDSLCCTNSPFVASDFFKFDYVGAPWRRQRPVGLIIDGGNGGFSLRDWEKSIECLKRFSPVAWPGGEDGFFAFHLDLMGAVVARMEDCALFATQGRFTDLTFGAHKIGLLNDEDLKKFIAYSPEALNIFPHLTRRLLPSTSSGTPRNTSDDRRKPKIKSPYALAVSFISLELGNPTCGETRSLIETTQNWTAFISLVERHGIAEIVLRLAQTHCLALPYFVFAKLKGLAVRHSASARARYKAMQMICEELRAKKLDFAVLKGTALLPLIYHDEARRPMRDIDILVRREQRAHVARSMEAIGFDLPKTHPDKYSRDSHQMPNATLTVDGFIISLEIHHDAIDRDTKGHLYFDESIELREVTWREITFAALNHEIMLHHLCRHLASRHPGSTLKLINVIDVIRYSETFSTEVDWDVIKRRYPHVLNTLRCLHVLLPLPATVVKALGGVSRETISGAGEIAMSLRDITVSSAPVSTKLKLMFCPSDWWLHLFYGVAPGKSLFWVKCVSHPSAIVFMIIRRAWSRLLGG